MVNPDDRCTICYAPRDSETIWFKYRGRLVCPPCHDLVNHVRRLRAAGWTQTEVNSLVIDVVSTMGDTDRAEVADTTRTLIAQLAERCPVHAEWR